MFKICALRDSMYCRDQFFSRLSKGRSKNLFLCMFNFIIFLGKQEIPKFYVR